MIIEWLYTFWRNCWMLIVILTFLSLFFGKIAMNAAAYSEHKDRFKAKCEKAGGVMFVPSGVKGWPKLECRNPEAIVHFDL